MYLPDFPNIICWIDCLYPIGCSCLLRHRPIDHKIVGLFLGSLYYSLIYNWTMVFTRCSIILNSHLQFLTSMPAPHPSKQWILSASVCVSVYACLILPILVNVRWHLLVFLICIFVMVTDFWAVYILVFGMLTYFYVWNISGRLLDTFKLSSLIFMICTCSLYILHDTCVTQMYDTYVSMFSCSLVFSFPLS